MEKPLMSCKGCLTEVRTGDGVINSVLVTNLKHSTIGLLRRKLAPSQPDPAQ